MSKKKNVTTITMDQLLANGWKKSKDYVLFAKKTIGRDKELGTLDLILHNYSNSPVFALSLPDGAMVNINPATIEELNAFEKLILSYEPNF
jgi:hypothetical protein